MKKLLNQFNDWCDKEIIFIIPLKRKDHINTITTNNITILIIMLIVLGVIESLIKLLK